MLHFILELANNEIPEDFPLLDVDENRLQQILYNVIGNAVKFTEAGHITVSANVISPGMASITITDTGIGIAPDQIDHIFEAFSQVDGSANRQLGGTGLGLSITRHLVHLHGGEIRVISGVGEGTELTLTLPLWNGLEPIKHETPPASITPLTPDSSVLVFSSQDGDVDSALTVVPKDTNLQLPLSSELLNPDHVNNAHILIVDDEPINRQILIDFLQSANYHVTAMVSGQATLDYLDQGSPPDLILLDAMMPRMTGYDVLKHIREIYPEDKLPVFLRQFKFEVQQHLTCLRRILQMAFCSQAIFSAYY